MLQTSALLGDVDVQSNIEMIAALNHLGRREVMQVMDRVNLTELRKRKVVKLSGGRAPAREASYCPGGIAAAADFR